MTLFSPVGAGVIATVMFAGVLAAQQARPDGAPSGGFGGRVINSVDSAAVRGVEIRLMPIDSTRRPPRGPVTVFVDSARSRLGISDSAGLFAIHGLAAGPYLFQLRRIGYSPLEGAVTVDTGSVRVKLPMEPTSRVLSTMTIRETSVDANKTYLDRVGYTKRSRGPLASSVATRNDIDRHRWVDVGDYLREQGLYDAIVLLDLMPLPVGDVRTYPMDQVLAIEVYKGMVPLDLEIMSTTLKAGQLERRTSRGIPRVLIWSARSGPR